MNRIREGYLYTPNPFNVHQISRTDLSPEKVDAIVFWTKNPEPIIRRLDELDARGYRYYFQFTLTAYPKVLEPSVPKEDELLSTFKKLSGMIGPGKIIWRFDPIILSDVTPEQFIVETFERLAEGLKGSTARVVISFVALYKSVARNLDKVCKITGIRFYDSSRTVEQVRRIACALAQIALANSMEIVSCAEKHDLSDLGIEPGKCIDDGLIERLFGIKAPSGKDRYQRPECGCIASRDVGQYNTCTHDCVYCYAASRKNEAHKNRAGHDPESPFLIAPARKPY